jgi:hypothetical protein
MHSFEPIEAVARVMAGFPHPWFVSGGWAIDLFVGQVTRAHEDLEVGMFRRDQKALRDHLVGWEMGKVVYGPEGGAWVPWPDDDWIELPLFQVRAHCPDHVPAEFEFFMNDASDEEWLCRRNPVITRPIREISRRSSRGIPSLVPEIQLLFKAKYHREKDEHDFRNAVELFTPAQREWLKQGLEIIHPGDSWLAALG